MSQSREAESTGNKRIVSNEKLAWMARLLELARKPITKVDSQFAARPDLQGWVVGAMSYLNCAEDWSNELPFVYVLQPGDTNIPFVSAEARAHRQLRQWEKELGGEVLVLMVMDQKQQETGGWLAQPVLKEWITKRSVAELRDLHDAYNGIPRQLMVRTAIIARTGRGPEGLMPRVTAQG